MQSHDPILSARNMGRELNRPPASNARSPRSANRIERGHSAERAVTTMMRADSRRSPAHAQDRRVRLESRRCRMPARAIDTVFSMLPPSGRVVLRFRSVVAA
jgi:hypothetical protein